MKSSGQRTDVRGRRTAGFTRHPPPATRHSRHRGFTLVEVLLAVSISVMVFSAMGILMSKCFMLWKDAMANWRMAQVSRISRERILCGGFSSSSNQPLTGLLGATNALAFSSGDWECVRYQTTAAAGTTYQLYGWGGSSEQNIWINRSSGSPSWAYGQGVASYPASAAPAVKADMFETSVSNKIVTISYRLRFSAAGKTFTQPHTISAWLINKED